MGREERIERYQEAVKRLVAMGPPDGFTEKEAEIIMWAVVHDDIRGAIIRACSNGAMLPAEVARIISFGQQKLEEYLRKDGDAD